MNLSTLALLTFSIAAGDVPQGYQALKSRNLKLDLEVDPRQQANVSHVELFVSRDRGGVWESAAQARPDQKFIPFTAREDGLYWLSMIVVYKDGTQDPANVAAAPPSQKLLIDTTAPILRIRDCRREGDDITVEWSVEDAFPSDERTKVEFRIAGGSDVSWKTVPVNAADRRGTRFNPNSNLGVQVRVTVEDMAGNSAVQQASAEGLNNGTLPTTELTAMRTENSGGLLPPPSLPTIAPIEPGAGTIVPPGPAPLVDLTSKPAPAAPAPLATSETAVMQPANNLPPAQPINFVRFDLPYQLESGPSGISRIDLYVTRDDGATWTKWSEHDGRETVLKVALDRRYNPQLEGTYGFRLVAVSGAGLSEAPPSRGSQPEYRVQVDLTPPIIRIFQPEADANQRDVLILKWEATDRNLGAEPIALEWSEGPSGPWKPVGDGNTLLPVAAGTVGNSALRVANTGTYAWRLPAQLPSHKLYLKVSAWDLAGNKSEVATPSPILVDLVKPRARIQGVVPSAGAAP